MSIDYRALCAQLADELERCRPLAEVPDCLQRARAALAAEPVAERPTTADLRQVFDDQSGYIDDDQVMWAGDFYKAVRAVLARWAHQPAPPAEGEVAELVVRLRRASDGASAMGWEQDSWTIARAAYLLEQRHPTPVPVAERLPSASHVYFEFVISDADYCTQAGGIAPTYAQALSEGKHYFAQYQQDGPHTLELRRVEVLNPDALPLPQGEVE